MARVPYKWIVVQIARPWVKIIPRASWKGEESKPRIHLISIVELQYGIVNNYPIFSLYSCLLEIYTFQSDVSFWIFIFLNVWYLYISHRHKDSWWQFSYLFHVGFNFNCMVYSVSEDLLSSFTCHLFIVLCLLYKYWIFSSLFQSWKLFCLWKSLLRTSSRRCLKKLS